MTMNSNDGYKRIESVKRSRGFQESEGWNSMLKKIIMLRMNELNIQTRWLNVTSEDKKKEQSRRTG